MTGRQPHDLVFGQYEVLEGFSQPGGAFTTIGFSVIIAVVRAFTAVSRAILSWRIISTAPSAVLGVAGDWLASTARAAASASRVSDWPAARRRLRSPRFTSATRCPARRVLTPLYVKTLVQAAKSAAWRAR